VGRLNTPDEQEATLLWGRSYRGTAEAFVDSPRPKELERVFNDDLKKYFALACLSRSKSASQVLVEASSRVVFKVRVLLEKSIEKPVVTFSLRSDDFLFQAFSGWFYGSSKKQGVSVRFPLTSCVPTPMCASGCYAHDALDAAPLPLIRGVLNGVIARVYEEGGNNRRKRIERLLQPHTRRAAIAAHREIQGLPPGWTRKPRIRFAHVGEAAAYPNFSNMIAMQVKILTRGEVDCVVYTRHPMADKLDPNLWVVNYTLDKTTERATARVPNNARIVYSAWGGETSQCGAVNFLEHHRWVHMKPAGKGSVCPATLPETTDRRCDALRCDFCFNKV